MHNAAFDAFALNWRYVAMPVRPGEVEAAVNGLAGFGLRGANVTVPHKQAVFPALHTVSPTARGLGAVNTLVVTRADDQTLRIHGENTDAAGFVGALRQRCFEPATGGAVLVVGAGGAARGVIYGLLEAGSERITVMNRSVDRAGRLVADLVRCRGDWAPRLSAAALTPEELVETTRDAALLVNATTVGMWPQLEGSIWPDDAPIPAHLVVFDLVYNPLETRLLQQARRAGATAIDGLGMLVRQGALAFDMWTALGIPIDEIDAVMRTACQQALGV